MNKIKYSYRFKTKKEFQDEFGGSWRSMVMCHWDSPSMDRFFGKDFEIFEIDSVKRIRQGEWYIRYGSWSISKDMIIKKIILPNYKPKRIKREI